MPLNVRRFCTSFFLVVFSFISIWAQTPTSGEVMRGRISKAKALIAVRNYPGAIYELENIRRETSDQTVHSVLNVLLMNCYLEQGDYKRAQDFLGSLFNDVKANKAGAPANYYAAAGQVIKGARNQFERYKALGLSVSDRNLAPEALTDLEKMREMLEKVVEQSKTISKDAKQTPNAFAVLEEASNARSVLARDDFDARRWKDEVADSREMLANSRSTVFNATNEPTPTNTNVPQNTVASNNPTNQPTNTLPVPTTTDATKTSEPTPVFKPVSNNPNDAQKSVPEQPATKETLKKEEPQKETPKIDNKTVAETDAQKTQRERRVDDKDKNSRKTENLTDPQTADIKTDSPLNVGSLLEYAVEKRNPVYPPNARTMRQTGIVLVELLIDESGEVAAVQKLSGPALLQNAAKDAVKKWKFKPFVRDGQPVKATGFLSFNFNL